MQMPVEVAHAAETLLQALKDTEAYQQYQTLRESVLADEVNQRLLERFARAQRALQMSAIAGREPREEDAAEFEKLSTLLYQSPEVSDYLLAQMKVQQLVAATMEKLTRECGMDVDIPGV